jgi:hypothetical protein
MEKEIKTIINEACNKFEEDTNQNLLKIELNSMYLELYIEESLDIFMPHYKEDMNFKRKMDKLNDQALRLLDSDYTSLHHLYVPLQFCKKLPVNIIKINGKKYKFGENNG